MIFRRSIVIDNDDSGFDGNKLSRVKVKILPEMKDVDDTLLPWIEPFKNSIGVSANTSEHSVPEIDSYIMVAILDDYWQEFRYVHGFYINGYSAYGKWTTSIAPNITDISAQTYPQPNIFQVFEDGSAFFRNTSTGELGYFNTNGTYFIFDSSGSPIIYSKDQSLKIYNDKSQILIDTTGELTIDTTTADFTIKNATCTIKGDSTKVLINNHLEIGV